MILLSERRINMAFDGIVTKAIASELQQLSGARIDKVFQPNKNQVLLGFYLDGLNYLLMMCTDSQNYRVHLTTYAKPNPKVAPNFCMVLRKHLIGLRLKNVITSDLERIITIEFEGFDDIDDIITKKLIIELMGKHCNLILLDDQNTIIDSLRHIVSEEESNRNIVPHVKYNYPTVSKVNYLAVSNFEQFEQLLKIEPSLSITDLPELISNTFNGISKRCIQEMINRLSITTITSSTLKQIYELLETMIRNTNNFKLDFLPIIDKKKDYCLIPSDKNNEAFHLNFFLDDFYEEKESSENFKIYRNSVLKLILDTLKKYNKRLLHINQKLEDCEDMDIYRIYGELITSNLYQIKEENVDAVELENYYDNNQLLTIPLDKRYSPRINAKRYFKKYHKLKNALEIVSVQKEETEKELNYIESIVYELENCTTLEEVSSIFDEISENVVFKEKTDSLKKKKSTKIKKSTLTKNKKVSFNPLKYTIDTYTLLVGRNNRENDYLTLKYAKKTDLWFHTKDIHGSHAVLLLDGSIPSNDVIIQCAEIVAYHSKARNSSNVPVDVCDVKYVKKPNGAKPGMVIYTNYQTFNVQPKNK